MISEQNELEDWSRAQAEDVRQQLADPPATMIPLQIIHPCNADD
jgi:hypothetical protein